MPADMQYKDGLRKDKFLNDLVIEAIKSGNHEKALEYLEILLQIEPEAVHAKALKKLILQKYIV